MNLKQIKYPKSKFSKNTTNLLSIKVALIDNKLVVFWLNLLFGYISENTSVWLQLKQIPSNKTTFLFKNDDMFRS